MAATYDETLPSAKDRVRLLVPDTVVASAEWSDEEIVAMLALEITDFKRSAQCAPYFVAEKLLRTLIDRYALKGKGIGRKKVDDLEVEYGAGRRETIAEVKGNADRLHALGVECEGVNGSSARRFRAIGPRKLKGE